MLVRKQARKRNANTAVASFMEIKAPAGPAATFTLAVRTAIRAKTIIQPNIYMISLRDGVTEQYIFGPTLTYST